MFENQFIFKIDEDAIESMYVGNYIYQLTFEEKYGQINLENLMINDQKSTSFEKYHIVIEQIQECTNIEIIGNAT